MIVNSRSGLFSEVTFIVDCAQLERMIEAADELGVSIEQFVADAVEEECYLTLGDS